MDHCTDHWLRGTLLSSQIGSCSQGRVLPVELFGNEWGIHLFSFKLQVPAPGCRHRVTIIQIPGIRIGGSLQYETCRRGACRPNVYAFA